MRNDRQGTSANDFEQEQTGTGQGESSGTQTQDEGIIDIGESHNRLCCMTVIGQIEGHYLLPDNAKATKYEHLLPRLAAVEENPDIDGVLLLLNTVGGDIEAGLAIAEMIAGMKKPTVSLVLGGGHSIGVPLAVSAKYSFIAPSAVMTLHPVRMTGLVLGVSQTFDYFKGIQERIVGFVSRNSHISPDRFRELMLTTGELVTDLGTQLESERAVAEGLIDSVGSLSDAITKLKEMCQAKND